MTPRALYAMQHLRRTKIVCTLGPSTARPGVLESLIKGGLNVARINFSHGTHAQHAETVANIRRAAAEIGRGVAILGDLQGPRIRIGKLAAPVELVPGHQVTLVAESAAGAGDIPVTYEALADDVSRDARILINDGLFELRVLEVLGGRIRCEVIHGGTLTSNKGINLPDVDVSASSLSDKDREDVAFAVEHDFDYLALSFVRRPEDIRQLRALIPKHLLVVAKLELGLALQNMDGILRETDAVMVARGDLGVELPFEEVPLAQKRIISAANRLSRPVITATQMLESMIENPRPTRAEVSDVANAVLDGTDAVMLSAETAAGAHPTLAEEAMRRIVREVEQHAAETESRDRRRYSSNDEPASTEETIAAATLTAVRMLHSKLIVVFTKGGFSARVVAAQRPPVPVLVLTDQPRTQRQLGLVWGVFPQLVPHCDTYEEMLAQARRVALELGFVEAGDRIIVTAGVPFDVPGTTNVMKVETV
ncbi:MAG: pyruvate kinase [Gemmatimonadaceae bacterium]|nr:pyruvate kinase [Gemmatimonadaceae bacterium]